MRNLIGHFRTALTAGFLVIVLFFIVLRNGYSFDSITQFLDTCSYNYKGFDIKLKEISIGEMYDDNVTFSKENKIEDFITTLGVGMSAMYEEKTKTLELTANMVNQTYAMNNDFSNNTQDMAINFMNEFSEYDRMNLRNSFSHSDEPIFFRDEFFRERGEVSSGFDQYINRFHADYSRDVFKQMNVTLEYDNNIYVFSGIDLENSILNQVGVESNYSITPDTAFLFSYEFANRKFEEGSDASINTVTTGIRQDITRKINFDGRAGLDFIDSYNDESFTRPVLEAAFSYRVDTFTLARISFTKRTNTNPYSFNISDSWRSTVAVTQQLSERFQCSLSGFYGEFSNLNSDFNQRTLGSSTLFTYDINKNLRGNLTYTFTDADSNTDTAGYIRNTVFLGLSAEF